MTVRLIARMDVKGPHLIKPVNLEGVRKVGDPREFALSYYRAGIDELFYMDAVASLYGRNSLSNLVTESVAEIFVPITVGGGIRSAHDVDDMLRAGADRIAINTAAIKSPALIDEIAKRFGSQCLVLSVEAKKTATGYEAYIDSGREKTGLQVLDWVREAVDRGAGEVLVTSVDREGTKQGFDVELVAAVEANVSVPVIACGGMGKLEHLDEVVDAGADGVAVAHVLHYAELSVQDLADRMRALGVRTRS